jgi:hypothetical protein
VTGVAFAVGCLFALAAVVAYRIIFGARFVCIDCERGLTVSHVRCTSCSRGDS